ncbi:hypothetical protein B0H19DRAFT_1057550 [Mycena capillaripes]|nr:hypothetical protein B0H19DRAFT_1057550 [Mycena capillaripes]
MSGGPLHEMLRKKGAQKKQRCPRPSKINSHSFDDAVTKRPLRSTRLSRRLVAVNSDADDYRATTAPTYCRTRGHEGPRGKSMAMDVNEADRRWRPKKNAGQRDMVTVAITIEADTQEKISSAEIARNKGQTKLQAVGPKSECTYMGLEMKVGV